MTSAAPKRPVLRYHGGKWRLAPWVISHLPDHEIYVEPFGGAGSVLMRKPRSIAEVYNDRDDDVVNVFRVLRDPDSAARLQKLLYLTPYSRTEFLESYDHAEDPVERARRTIVRMTMSHGTTGWRRGMTGFRSKCWAQRRNEASIWRDYPEQIEWFVDRLRGVVIECRPALEVIAQHDSPKTLFYVDPPYVLGTRSSVRTKKEAEGEWRSYRYNLTDDEHLQLIETLRAIEGAAVISGYRSSIYDELLQDYTRVSTTARADGGHEREEYLWISPSASAQQHELFKKGGGDAVETHPDR